MLYMTEMIHTAKVTDFLQLFKGLFWNILILGKGKQKDTVFNGKKERENRESLR